MSLFEESDSNSINKMSDEEKNGMKKISMDDVVLSNEAEKYLMKVLCELLKISGTSGDEKKVLDYIVKEVKNCKRFKSMTVERNKAFGLFVAVPPKDTVLKCALFDAHVDCVQEKHIKPEFYTMKVKDMESRVILKATGIDNRIHTALLLTLIKYNPLKHTELGCLFSVEEECGMVGVGNFHNSEKMEKEYKITFDEIVCLDVTQAKLENNNSCYGNCPVIGGGIIPTTQSFAEYDHFGWCNAWALKEKYPEVYTCRHSVGCCYMHAKESFASLSDLFELLAFFTDNYEKNLFENMKSGKHAFLKYQEPEKE